MEHFEQARRELVTILNQEILATQKTRNDLIERFHRGVLAQRRGFMSEERAKATDPSLEDMEEELLRENGLMLVRTNQPYVINKGQHQAIISLGNDLVAKVKYKCASSEVIEIASTYLFLQETAQALGSLGLVIPRHELYRAEWSDDKIVVSSEVTHYTKAQEDQDIDDLIHNREEKPRAKNYPNICITADLREGKKYSVQEYDEEIVKTLPNGREISDQFHRSFAILQALTTDNSASYVLFHDPHLDDDTPECAIWKMFLIQIPAEKGMAGRLVLGDLDHVHVYKR